MGFFDFVKKWAANIFSAVKHVANKVKERGSMIFGGAKKIMEGVKSTYDQVTKIPVIGNYLKQAGDTVMELPIPYTPGISLKTGLKTAEQAVNIGNKIFN